MTPAARRAVVALVWAVAAGVLAWALVRALGLERGFPLVPLVAWTPFLIPVAVAAAAAAAVLRSRVPLALSVAACALLAVAVAPRALGGGYEPPGGASGPELQVMAANLKLGKADPGRIVELVRDEGVDVLCVQELTAELAAALDRAGLAELLPERTGEPAPSLSGSAIYSRHPLRTLPNASPPGYPFVMPRAEVRVTPEASGTPAAPAAAGAPGAPGTRSPAVEVVSVHPVPPTSSAAVTTWREGLEALEPLGSEADESAATEAPTLLVGDFNATLDHGALRDVLDAGFVDAGDATGGGLTPTWPQGLFRPPVTIDHVLADERIAVEAYDVHDLPGSDHRAVVATVRLP